ncbi:MAG: cytochrome b/b6 domain-containing protein [Luteolibacter sp.]|jgi:hypothetical protein
MSKSAKPLLGTLSRRIVSLLTALTFMVLAVTGVLAFMLPFSITIIGLHALMGFVFVGLIGMHIFNNSRPLLGYLRGRALWGTLVVTAVLTGLFWWQPAPVKTVLSWSGNLGPAMQRFEISEQGMMTFDYVPDPQYRMNLSVRLGPKTDPANPPQIAIWLENQGGYHIKTLLEPTNSADTVYWAYKHAGWEQAKREAERLAAEYSEADAIASATPNGSFDPADYILPGDAENATPYQLLLEIKQAGGDQPSLVHAVEIDNRLPKTFQLLELRGYPKRVDDSDADGEWALYFVDASFGPAIDLIDSALLTISRGE